MRDYDLEVLTHFFQRPGMYCGEETANNLASFLYAYQLGAHDACRFIETLSEYLLDKYHIGTPATGLSGQILNISEQQNRDAVALFKEEGLRLLQHLSDDGEQARYANILRKKLLDLLQALPDAATWNWIAQWYVIIRQVKEWRGENLPIVIIELLDELQHDLTVLNAQIDPAQEKDIPSPTLQRFERLHSLLT